MTDGEEDRPTSRWGPIGKAVSKMLDHPRTALVVGVIGVVATVATFEVSQGGGGGSSTPKTTASEGNVGIRTGKLPPLDLNQGAQCSDLEQSAQHNLGRTEFIDSPGTIDGGTGGLEGVVLPNGRYGNLVEAVPGGEVEVSAKLHNSAYSDASEVTLTIHLSAYNGTCWRLIGVVNSRTNAGPEPLGPMLIRLNGAKGTLDYVTGSTTLFGSKDNVLVPRLADGIINGGITLPLEIPGGTTEFVNFRVRMRVAH